MTHESGPSHERVPLIPEHVLRRHRVLEETDHRFRAAARLLQALWREEEDLPIGTHTTPEGTRRKLGSRLSHAAGRAGHTFLAPSVAAFTRREVAYREIGAFIDERRLYTNLLSSQPLTFNLLAPLALDLDLATRVIHHLWPDLRESKARARVIRFEHSPGRGSPTLTADGSAFDAALYYERPVGLTGIIAIEMKYSESMNEPVAALRSRYDELSRLTGLYFDPDSVSLRTKPLQQFWREHMLAQAMLMRGDVSEGRLVVICPSLNRLVRAATADYRSHLVPPQSEHVQFSALSLEEVIDCVAQAGEESYADKLRRRYTDFRSVDAALARFIANDLGQAVDRVDPDPTSGKSHD